MSPFTCKTTYPDDISVVEAGQDITAYDASSPLRLAAGNNVAGFQQSVQPLGAGVGAPNAGDIQVGGPGTLEVVAGRNLNLGNDSGKNPNDTISGDGLYTGPDQRRRRAQPLPAVFRRPTWSPICRRGLADGRP